MSPVVAAAQRWPALGSRLLAAGRAGGISAWPGMRFVPLPRSQAGVPRPDTVGVVNGLLIHTIGIGTPAGYFARRMMALGSGGAHSWAGPSITPHSGAPMINPREQWLTVFERENATTLKVMRAYPQDKAEFQPHPIAASARKLMWTFAIEQAFLKQALDGTLTMPPTMPAAPDTMAEVIAAWQKATAEVAALVRAATEEKLGSSITFFAGPGTLSQVPLMQVMWLMLLDSIHHRGQLSVYLRMVGGKVPSIYGPTHDEPWM